VALATTADMARRPGVRAFIAAAVPHDCRVDIVREALRQGISA
jgi:hypothetical protein